jgi:processive 1,2-diacylglycerol beta-glucosyltransferase
MKVLIFTETKVGEGHYQAAKAIETAFYQAYGANTNVKIVSGLRCVHPFIEWVVVQSYFLMLSFFPWLWKWMYTKTKKSSFIQTYFFAHRLSKIIKLEAPVIILCTHPSCIPALSQIKKKGRASCTLGVVCTDFDFHPFLVSPFVDFFFVPHSLVKEKLNQHYHISEDRIYDYGIPLRLDFERFGLENNISPLKKRNVLQVLIIGGSTGYGRIEEILEAFRPYQGQFRLTVITGKNNKLYRRLQHPNFEKVRVMGYVTNMKDWLSYADLVISKPGGLTVSETIACGTPFIMINPIPGHEEANKRYLEHKGLGVFVSDISTIPLKVRELYNHREGWKEWRLRIQAQQKRNAARKIVYTLTSQ